MTRSKSFLAAASAALAVFPVFAEVDWTASPIIVNEGTRANPVVLSEAVTASAELHVGKNADGALEFLLERNPSYYHAEQEPER